MPRQLNETVEYQQQEHTEKSEQSCRDGKLHRIVLNFRRSFHRIAPHPIDVFLDPIVVIFVQVPFRNGFNFLICQVGIVFRIVFGFFLFLFRSEVPLLLSHHRLCLVLCLVNVLTLGFVNALILRVINVLTLRLV